MTVDQGRKGPMVLERLQHAVSRARVLVDRFDPAPLSGLEARAAAEAFVELEKLAAAGKTLAAGRLDETGAWVGDGSHRSIEAFMAAVGGTSVGAAMGAMGTARRIKAQPAVSDALRNGKLSPVQADAISAAAKADLDAAAELFELANTAGLKGLKAECDRVCAAAASRASETENYERISSQRALRHRRLADGTGVIDIRGPLDRTAAIMAGLEPLEQELFEQNRKAKRIVHPEAVAFDALVQMAGQFGAPADTGVDDGADATERPENENENENENGPGPAAKAKTRGSRPLAMIVVHISHAAYERGWTEPGEICEIEGIGSIPVGVARQLASDSILKAVVIDGVDVTRVSHFGRTISAHLRTAIETRDRTCVIAGCEIDRHLQIDHNIPVAARGPTCLENLARVCHHHHAMKTLHDLRRTGPLGQQKLVTKADHARAGPGP